MLKHIRKKIQSRKLKSVCYRFIENYSKRFPEECQEIDLVLRQPNLRDGLTLDFVTDSNSFRFAVDSQNLLKVQLMFYTFELNLNEEGLGDPDYTKAYYDAKNLLNSLIVRLINQVSLDMNNKYPKIIREDEGGTIHFNLECLYTFSTYQGKQKIESLAADIMNAFLQITEFVDESVKNAQNDKSLEMEFSDWVDR
jgi:hypothetical protein